MPRLPIPGADSGNWGHILNEFLAVTLNSDGTLKDNAVTANTIADLAVTDGKIDVGAVTAATLANNAVTTSAIADDNVTTAKLADAAVENDKLAANAVNTTNIVDTAVNSDKLASNAVITAKILNSAVTEDKLATDAVTVNKIANNTITNAKIAAGANIAQSKIENLTTDIIRVKYDWVPTDHGLIAWTDDPKVNANGIILGAAGTLHLVRLHVPVAATVTNIIMYCNTEGTTLTASQNFAALYTAAGTLLAQTVDQTTAWSTTGLKTMALASSQGLSVGDYYVGLWSNGSALPQFARGSALAAQLVNVGLTAPNLRIATANTGLTTTAPATLGAQTSGSRSYWAALS